MAPQISSIRCCLFDMDGLLLDTEDLYSLCTNEVLREYGKPDLPWNIKAQLQGRPFPDASRIFTQWAQLPCSYDEFMVKVKIHQAKYFPSAKPLPGVPNLLHNLTSSTTSPHLRIALATSSNKHNFSLKSSHMEDLFKVFPQENRVLGDDPRIAPGRGKPAPDIYLLALKTINDVIKREGKEAEIKPEECLVFEDAVPGVEAGRRAGMQVVWCPHPGLAKEYEGREQEVLAGLTGTYAEGAVKDAGSPGKIDDGFATLLKTLENFPYEKFGMKVNAAA